MSVEHAHTVAPLLGTSEWTFSGIRRADTVSTVPCGTAALGHRHFSKLIGHPMTRDAPGLTSERVHFVNTELNAVRARCPESGQTRLN